MTTNTTTHDFSDTTVDAVTVAYRDADVSGKAAMRRAIDAAIDAAIRAVDIESAGRLVTYRDAITVAPKSTSSVDYVARVRDMRATLVAAVAAIDAGSVTLPDGVTVEFPDDMSGGTVDPKSVARYVTVTGRKSGRGDVAAWIDATLGDDAMTIADMRNAHTPTDDYPTVAPSAGAIGAMLDRDGAADFGITVTDVDGKKAAVRA